MKTLTIRGIDDELSQKIKKAAEQEHRSMNQWIVEKLKQFVGMAEGEEFKEYHDLDYLAGTWSEDEAREFDENTVFFEKVDADMWK